MIQAIVSVAFCVVALPYILCVIAILRNGDKPFAWLFKRTALFLLGIRILSVLLWYLAGRKNEVLGGLAGYVMMALTWPDLYLLTIALSPFKNWPALNSSEHAHLFFGIALVPTAIGVAFVLVKAVLGIRSFIRKTA